MLRQTGSSSLENDFQFFSDSSHLTPPPQLHHSSVCLPKQAMKVFKNAISAADWGFCRVSRVSLQKRRLKAARPRVRFKGDEDHDSGNRSIYLEWGDMFSSTCRESAAADRQQSADFWEGLSLPHMKRLCSVDLGKTARKLHHLTSSNSSSTQNSGKVPFNPA